MPSSLAEFAASQDTRDCDVCRRVPPELAAEIETWRKSQRNTRIGLGPVIMAWLEAEHKMQFEEPVFRRHIAGRHWAR
jgi:hypothetical protein